MHGVVRGRYFGPILNYHFATIAHFQGVLLAYFGSYYSAGILVLRLLLVTVRPPVVVQRDSRFQQQICGSAVELGPIFDGCIYKWTCGMS